MPLTGPIPEGGTPFVPIAVAAQAAHRCCYHSWKAANTSPNKMLTTLGRRGRLQLSGSLDRHELASPRLSDFNLDSHFNDLGCRNAKICVRPLGVALHEGVETLPPYQHAGNALGRNNRFPADVLRDFRQTSTAKLRLLVSKAQALRNRRTVHEAVMQSHPGDTRGEVLDFRTFILRYTRLF